MVQREFEKKYVILLTLNQSVKEVFVAQLSFQEQCNRVNHPLIAWVRQRTALLYNSPPPAHKLKVGGTLNKAKVSWVCLNMLQPCYELGWAEQTIAWQENDRERVNLWA